LILVALKKRTPHMLVGRRDIDMTMFDRGRETIYAKAPKRQLSRAVDAAIFLRSEGNAPGT
jgi:hypothetical protein